MKFVTPRVMHSNPVPPIVGFGTFFECLNQELTRKVAHTLAVVVNLEVNQLVIGHATCTSHAERRTRRA